MHEPITTAICAMPLADMFAVVEKRTSARGQKHLVGAAGWRRRNRPIDARQPVVARDLLRAQMLLTVIG